MQTLLDQHTNPSEPLHKRLSSIPISFWEDATPNLDLAIRETIRLVVNFTALRRHLPGRDGGSLRIPGMDRDVSNGEFLAYNISDANLNPDIYTNPEVFDPHRYSPGREEDKRETYAYLGWGAGE
jgi:cytochrome P450